MRIYKGKKILHQVQPDNRDNQDSGNVVANSLKTMDVSDEHVEKPPLSPKLYGQIVPQERSISPKVYDFSKLFDLSLAN